MVPDYYAMLGVDPGADRSAIEAALARKQPVWSSGTRNPKTKHTYQSYLDQIPVLRQALMGNMAARAAYDAERDATLRLVTDRKLDALQKRIRLRAAKGGLTVSDRKLLREEAVKFGLTPEVLDRLIEPIPPMPDAPGGADDPPELPADVLDPVMRRQLRVALDHLGKLDLYDALAVPRDSPAREIASRADAERQRWMKKSQVTAEKTAWLEVVTLAQSHLTTPPSRARYDRTLVLEAEELLSSSIAFAVQGLPSLDVGTRATLLDEAAALGITPERADRLVARSCRTLGVAREGGAGSVVTATPSSNGSLRLLRCRACSGVTPFDRVAKTKGSVPCRHCGASLRWACPTCRRPHWIDEPRCKCGFQLSWYEPFVRHFEAAQHAFKGRDYAQALAHLRRAREFAPDHVGSRKGVEKVRERLTEIDRARASWEIARSARRLVAARAAVEEWGRLVDPSATDRREASDEVVRLLREASFLAARARSRERTDPASARELYRKSLAIAADLPEAMTGLDRCPPDPPSNLTAEFEGDRVRLRWSPPPPDGLGPVSFVLLRKAETALKHPADGVRIGLADRPEFEDAGVVSGTSVAYAVLSRRGETDSVGAVALGPIFLIGEVRDVRIDTRNREIDLSWSPPRGASDVRVVRKSGGPPTGPLDGDRIDSLLDQAHDRGLETDRVYHYGIFAVYRTPDGRATASRGVFVSAQPHTPVHAVDTPTLSLGPGGRVRVRWVEPSKGIVKLLRTPRPLPYPPGTRLSAARIAAIEGDWVEVTAPDSAEDAPPAAAAGACFYTPLNSWGGNVTVGHPAAYSCLADPSELRASRLGDGRAHLRWRWSEQATQSVVVYRSGSPPTGPEDPAASVETVLYQDYSRQGHHTISLPAHDQGPWHVAVYSRANRDGGPATSPGLEPSARTVVPGSNPEVIVSYRFRRSRLPRRRWSVTLQTEPPGASIPPTVLVTHPRTVPLSADDGEVVAQFPPSADKSRFDLPAGVNLARVRARVFADPRAEPNTLTPFRLRHPESDATRV